MKEDYKHSELTELIIKCLYRVYNELGNGFMGKVYQNSLLFELNSIGLNVQPQNQIKVYYREKMVGEYYADIIVDDVVNLALNAAEAIVEEHEFQPFNYLKAKDIEVGLLLNFGKKPEVKRKIFTNN